MMTGTPLQIAGLEKLAALVDDVVELYQRILIRRGYRVQWLAGDGQYALQLRHRCRDARGRFVPCRSTCPEWDDIALCATQDDIETYARTRAAMADSGALPPRRTT